jgi:hypothetical protein
MTRPAKPRPATVITWIAALAIAGGLIRLALDDEAVEVALPEPQRPEPSQPGSEVGADPAELATSLGAALSRSTSE